MTDKQLKSISFTTHKHGTVLLQELGVRDLYLLSMGSDHFNTDEACITVHMTDLIGIRDSIDKLLGMDNIRGCGGCI